MFFMFTTFILNVLSEFDQAAVGETRVWVLNRPGPRRRSSSGLKVI